MRYTRALRCRLGVSVRTLVRKTWGLGVCVSGVKWFMSNWDFETRGRAEIGYLLEFIIGSRMKSLCWCHIPCDDRRIKKLRVGVWKSRLASLSVTSIGKSSFTDRGGNSYFRQSIHKSYLYKYLQMLLRPTGRTGCWNNQRRQQQVEFRLTS